MSTFYIRAQSTEQGCDKVWRSGDSKKPTLISGTVRLTHPPNTELNPQQSSPNNTYQTPNPTINNNPYKRQVHSSSFEKIGNNKKGYDKTGTWHSILANTADDPIWSVYLSLQRNLIGKAALFEQLVQRLSKKGF